MTGKASRDRGANAERAVVTYLRSVGFPQARRHHGADGRAPGDIMGVPDVTIEVKDRASSAWPTWREQLLNETPAGHTPILVRRIRGNTDVGTWVAETTEGDWARLWRPGSVKPYVRRCPRTDGTWVRVTFADLINLTRKETV